MLNHSKVSIEGLSVNLLRPKTFGKVYGVYNVPHITKLSSEKICTDLLGDRFFFYHKINSFNDLSKESLMKLKESIDKVKVVDSIFIEVSPNLQGEALGRAIDYLRAFNIMHLDITIILCIEIGSISLETFYECLTFESKFLDGVVLIEENECKVFKERYGELSEESILLKG